MQSSDSGNNVLMIKPEDYVEVIRTESRMELPQILHAISRAIPRMHLWLPRGRLHDNIQNVSGNCSDGVQWLYVILNDCVTDTQGYASDIFGFVSILLWVFVSTPQMVKNFRHIEGVAGISVFLIAQWTLGDTTNLVGCIMTKQLPLQMYLAIYFVFADLILFSQYLWFRRWQYKQKKTQKEKPNTPKIVLCLSVGFIAVNGLLQKYLPVARPMPVVHHPAGRNILHIEIFHDLEDEVGYAIGVISSLFYIGSRLSQIYKNYKRKSTDGLSLLMFWLAILGNVTYGISILVRSLELQWIIKHLPWLVGSLGVVTLDITLVIQFKIYGANEYERLVKEDSKDEEVPVNNGHVNTYGSVNSDDVNTYGSVNNPDYVQNLYSSIKE